MSIQKEVKQDLIKKFAQTPGDTGSPEVQVAVLTTRITNMSAHMKDHKKDLHSRRGLLMMVNRRRSLLDYLKRVSMTRYKTLIEALGIRR